MLDRQTVNWHDVAELARENGWRKSRNPLRRLGDLITGYETLIKRTVDLENRHTGQLRRSRKNADEGSLFVYYSTTFQEQGIQQVELEEAIFISSSPASATLEYTVRRDRQKTTGELLLDSTGQVPKPELEDLRYRSAHITPIYTMLALFPNYSREFSISPNDIIDFQRSTRSLITNLGEKEPQRPFSRLVRRY